MPSFSEVYEMLMRKGPGIQSIRSQINSAFPFDAVPEVTDILEYSNVGKRSEASQL